MPSLSQNNKTICSYINEYQNFISIKTFKLLILTNTTAYRNIVKYLNIVKPSKSNLQSNLLAIYSLTSLLLFYYQNIIDHQHLSK